MTLFYKQFSGKSKKNNSDYYSVVLLDVDQKNTKVFERALFVEKDAYDRITAKKFKFGDVVEVVAGDPPFFGAPQRLEDLNLVEESAFFD